MVRTALWLLSEVGVCKSFTKEQHRRAFAGISQADRRMRDLRQYGWIIHTSAEDATLNPSERRLITIGAPVWDLRERKSASKNALSAKLRLTTLSAHNFQCSICGIMAGESYPEASNEAAVLGVATRTVLMPDGSSGRMLAAECKRCKAGIGRVAVDLDQLSKNIASLPSFERSVFMCWAQDGRRNHLDRVWSEFVRLPLEARKQLLRSLVA